MTAETQATTKPRNVHLDITKGILGVQMVLSHTIRLCGQTTLPPINLFLLLSALVSFSGFIFCFGYSTYLAYYRKEKIPYKRIFVTAFKILIAFYISGTAYRVLVNHESFRLSSIFNILLLHDVPGYSEFLLTSLLALLIATALSKKLLFIVDSVPFLSLLISALLCLTFVNYDLITVPQVGLLIGTTRFSAFPVLQYFPLYLIGIYFARAKIVYNQQLLIISIVVCSIFAAHCILLNEIPMRFPPSLLWVTTSIGMVYLYYLLSYLVSKIEWSKAYLSHVGENVLFYLILSNIMLFAVKGVYPNIELNIVESLLFYLCLLTAIYNIHGFAKPAQKKN